MAALIPSAVGAVTGIIKTIKGAHQNKLANSVVVPEANYNTSPYAQAVLNQATQYKNARMTGAAEAGNNIMANQSNAVGAINRNAMSGSQALSLIMGAQGQTNQAFNNLRQQEGQDEQFKMNNWNNANAQMIGEDDKVYADRVRKQNLAINEKNALRSASTQNLGNGMNDFGNAAMLAGNASFASSPDRVDMANPELYTSNQFRNNNGTKIPQ